MRLWLGHIMRLSLTLGFIRALRASLVEGCLSGQKGWAVNPLTSVYGGSNPPPSILRLSQVAAAEENAGVAQLARALAFQAKGRGFESRLPLHLQPSGQFGYDRLLLRKWGQDVFLLASFGY